MLKYDVYDKETGECLSDTHYCIVTPNGDVAWWDQSEGWLEDDNQDRFIVRVTQTE